MINFKLLKSCIRKRDGRYHFVDSEDPTWHIVSHQKHSRIRFMRIILRSVHEVEEFSHFLK